MQFDGAKPLLDQSILLRFNNSHGLYSIAFIAKIKNNNDGAKSIHEFQAMTGIGNGPLSIWIYW